MLPDSESHGKGSISQTNLDIIAHDISMISSNNPLSTLNQSHPQVIGLKPVIYKYHPALLIFITGR